jgi:hypothetical protein
MATIPKESSEALASFLRGEFNERVKVNLDLVPRRVKSKCCEHLQLLIATYNGSTHETVSFVSIIHHNTLICQGVDKENCVNIQI